MQNAEALTWIDPAKGKRKLSWRTLEPAATTPTRPVSPKPQDALQADKQHLGTLRLLGRSWPAPAIAPCLCSPAPVFGGETSEARHHRHACTASTPASPRS